MSTTPLEYLYIATLRSLNKTEEFHERLLLFYKESLDAAQSFLSRWMHAHPGYSLFHLAQPLHAVRIYHHIFHAERARSDHILDVLPHDIACFLHTPR